MKTINLIFPHQLFNASPLLQNGHEIYLVEEFLFFKQYKFHKQKIAFHRATMKRYEEFLLERNHKVSYIQSGHHLSDIRNFNHEIITQNIDRICFIDCCDDWLNQRIQSLSDNCELKMYESPQFINSNIDLQTFFKKDKKFFFHTTFYKQQRKKLQILLDSDQKPIGGNWSFDEANRKKYPKDKIPPSITFPDQTEAWIEAVEYTNTNFADHLGEITMDPIYPVTFEEAELWLDQFLRHRFAEFGSYEDTIVKDYSILHHSVLSPLMNVGLLLPQDIVERILTSAHQEDVPLNSTEGIIRQIIGWREFVRGMYLCKGRFSRNRNFWNFNRKIPKSFYDGTTGILPVDQTIKKVLRTGYCHHIERLMVLGNFMLLCEFDPNEVYRWFMELFIDAYDWVMVPNVYGMSQFADGGTFATKPYIGGSNYIRKMSNYPRGDWEAVWDGLFWHFVIKHEDFFRANPRSSMLVHALGRMSVAKRKQHVQNGDRFINDLLKQG